MRLGMFMMPVHPPTRPLFETLAEDTEKSLLADRLGFEELWIGEHFSASSEPIASPLMFMASLLPRTRNLAFGTAVLNLPNRHPAVIAAEAALFDHLSQGRFLMGIGPGGLASDMELFGYMDGRVRERRMMETIDAIERIWSQDPPYDIPGEFASVTLTKAVVPEYGIGFMPKPYQKPRPPICISVSTPNSPSVRLAALRGWGPISSNVIPRYALASHWETYRAGCAEAGRAASGGDWRIARNIIVAATDAEAEARLHTVDGSSRYYFTYMREALRRAGRLSFLKPRPEMSDAETTVEAIMEECVIHGAPRTVLAKLIAFRERVGPFGTLLMTGVDWSGPNGAWERESMRRLAEEVMPALRRHITAEAAE